MNKIAYVDWDNAKEVAKDILDKYEPERIDFEQCWRILLLDLLTPYLDYPQGRCIWNIVMDECQDWEEKRGL